MALPNGNVPDTTRRTQSEIKNPAGTKIKGEAIFEWFERLVNL